jgi:hypothetical protein
LTLIAELQAAALMLNICRSCLPLPHWKLLLAASTTDDGQQQRAAALPGQ